MASAVDHLVALAFGFLDGLCFALAFSVFTLLTVSFLPLTGRALLAVVGVGAAIGLPLAGYSTYRFHRDGQAFAAVRGFFRFWKRGLLYWLLRPRVHT